MQGSRDVGGDRFPWAHAQGCYLDHPYGVRRCDGRSDVHLALHPWSPYEYGAPFRMLVKSPPKLSSPPVYDSVVGLTGSWEGK